MVSASESLSLNGDMSLRAHAIEHQTNAVESNKRRIFSVVALPLHFLQNVTATQEAQQ
jgi:hypothetical protein